MKRTIVAAAAGIAAVAAVLIWTTGTTAAQDVRLRAQNGQIHLLGGGASIGVTIRDVTTDDADRAKLTAATGVVIETVHDGTPASRAGLRGGDIVLEFDGERVRSVQQFTRLVQESAPGRSVNAVVMRDGARQTLALTPEPRGAIDNLITRRILPNVDRLQRDFAFDTLVPEARTLLSPRQLGATLTPLSDQLGGYFGVGNGVLVSSVQADSAASEAGLRAGDVITQMNGRRVDSPNDVVQTVRNAGPGSELELTVTRDRKELALKVRIPDRSGVSGRRGVAL
jgi:serine protease Do